MAQFVIPASENANQAAIDLYLSVFDAASVDQRIALLADAGMAVVPASKARMLGRRSLTWATAAEVGVQALATVRDPDLLSTADAIVAALRVARGLAEDCRSTNDVVIDELFAAAHSLAHSAAPSAALATVLADCRKYHEALRAGNATPRTYLGALHTHSNGVCGAVLRELRLVDTEIASQVHAFAVSLGVLYQLTTDLQAAAHTVSPNSLTHTLVAQASVDEQIWMSVLDVIAAHSRLLLESMKQVERYYSHNALLHEILLRANIVLRDCARLLRTSSRR
ncbi:hypothetical protein KUG88_24970 [Rhodococcus rhodochrous]|uniref:hypothetical protein n=1 Tax=Rhodococcus rhodochrous TaxID=1829 RepID=UPI001E59E52C|nr:hypothetical protein [Rhodococcus rhodochrous]MCB8913375.1 hypothetical protein [Rhodococcus rhodochrous]